MARSPNGSHAAPAVSTRCERRRTQGRRSARQRNPPMSCGTFVTTKLPGRVKRGRSAGFRPGTPRSRSVQRRQGTATGPSRFGPKVSPSSPSRVQRRGHTRPQADCPAPPFRPVPCGPPMSCGTSVFPKVPGRVKRGRSVQRRQGTATGPSRFGPKASPSSPSRVQRRGHTRPQAGCQGSGRSGRLGHRSAATPHNMVGK